MNDNGMNDGLQGRWGKGKVAKSNEYQCVAEDLVQTDFGRIHRTKNLLLSCKARVL